MLTASLILKCPFIFCRVLAKCDKLSIYRDSVQGPRQRPEEFQRLDRLGRLVGRGADGRGLRPHGRLYSRHARLTHQVDWSTLVTAAW